MPDQHKLTREEHRVAVVKFTQELTDHPAGQCWQRLRVKLILIERCAHPLIGVLAAPRT